MDFRNTKRLNVVLLIWQVFRPVLSLNVFICKPNNLIFRLTPFLIVECHCLWEFVLDGVSPLTQSELVFLSPQYCARSNQISAQAFRHCPIENGDLGLNIPCKECAMGHSTVARAISLKVDPSRMSRKDRFPRTPTTEDMMTPPSSVSAPGAATNTGSDG